MEDDFYNNQDLKSSGKNMKKEVRNQQMKVEDFLDSLSEEEQLDKLPSAVSERPKGARFYEQLIDNLDHNSSSVGDIRVEVAVNESSFSESISNTSKSQDLQPFSSKPFDFQKNDQKQLASNSSTQKPTSISKIQALLNIYNHSNIEPKV